MKPDAEWETEIRDLLFKIRASSLTYIQVNLIRDFVNEKLRSHDAELEKKLFENMQIINHEYHKALASGENDMADGYSHSYAIMKTVLSDIQSLLKEGEKKPPSFKEMYGYLKKK